MHAHAIILSDAQYENELLVEIFGVKRDAVRDWNQRSHEEARRTAGRRSSYAFNTCVERLASHGLLAYHLPPYSSELNSIE
ncbi:MAG: hypothetical protein Rhob2KO_53540 [Rhodopirellula baltica]